MRTMTVIIVATLALSSAALAQNGAGGDGTSPQNKGSSGWTGGHPETGGATTEGSGQASKPKDATTGQGVQVHDEAEAKDQPTMATGKDLKGPPMQFAPSKTPE